MMAASHVAWGAAAWSAAALVTGQPATPEASALAALGALLPDIDHPESWVGRRLPFVSIPVSAVFGHRGITHSLVAVVAGIAALLVYGLGALVAPLAIGYLSHLAADACTPSGVPLLWPNRRPFALGLVRTGSSGEMLLTGLVTAGWAWSVGLIG